MINWLIFIYCAVQDIVQAVRFLPYMGAKTNTAAALDLLNTIMTGTAYGARAAGEAQRSAIVVVNGQSTVNPSDVSFV